MCTRDPARNANRMCLSLLTVGEFIELRQHSDDDRPRISQIIVLMRRQLEFGVVCKLQSARFV